LLRYKLKKEMYSEPMAGPLPELVFFDIIKLLFRVVSPLQMWALNFSLCLAKQNDDGVSN
jgi:hypothetical protein